MKDESMILLALLSVFNIGVGIASVFLGQCAIPPLVVPLIAVAIIVNLLIGIVLKGLERK